MDKKKSILNVSVSILSRVILLIIALYVRRLLIQYIGNEVNGLNTLYANIISMLAVAELGIGSAIVFSMYKPIIAGDKKQVAALYRLHKKMYIIVGTVVFGTGLLLLPLLPNIISDYEILDVNVYLTFFLALTSVSLTYLFSAKTSLIEAHKENYITTGILTISRLIRYGLQIIAILVYRSFTAFLVSQIIETIIVWFFTELVIRRNHREIIMINAHVDQTAKKEITRNIKALFMHKIGTVLVKSIDSIIISGFIGVVALGKYTNYSFIAGVVAGVIALFFSPLTAVVGHLCAEGNPYKAKKYFNHFYCLNFVLGMFFFLGYFAVIDYVVIFCFGTGLEVSRSIAFIITLNQFIQYMRSAPLLFRDASGTFYYDRWKPLAEGMLNVILSVFFVKVFPEEYRVVGVITATIITTLLICDIVEPYVVFRHVFKQSSLTFCLINYAGIAWFIGCMFILNLLIQPYSNSIVGFIVNGFLSIGVSIVSIAILSIADKSFRREIRILFEITKEYTYRLLRLWKEKKK